MDTEIALMELQKYQKHLKDYRCKQCTHLGRYDAHLFYCTIRPSFYTQNLKLRVKAGDVACSLYKS